MSKVIIFGGSGFIGTHLAKQMLSSGNKVTIVDLKEPRIEHSELTYIQYDVRELTQLDISEDFDVIYNFAAVHTTPGHPTHEYYETNVKGATEVCSFAERHGVDQIVFTSSISVYGPDEEQKDERSKLTPNSAYGYSKVLAEGVHNAWLERSSGRKLVTIRPAVVFGPGEGGNFTRLAKLLQKGFFVYPGRKDTIKSCIYVEDLLQLIAKALETSQSFELLNGAYPERYTLENIIECFRAAHFPKAKTFSVPKSFVLSAAKLLELFNFMNIGIHPERVMKLIKSTNIYPFWLDKNKVQIEGNLRSALQRWSADTQGKFD